MPRAAVRFVASAPSRASPIPDRRFGWTQVPVGARATLIIRSVHNKGRKRPPFEIQIISLLRSPRCGVIRQARPSTTTASPRGWSSTYAWPRRRGARAGCGGRCGADRMQRRHRRTPDVAAAAAARTGCSGGRDAGRVWRPMRRAFFEPPIAGAGPHGSQPWGSPSPRASRTTASGTS